MLVIGERINTSRRQVEEWVRGRDAGAILGEARRQVEGGAHYLDVNCGTLREGEPEALEWLVRTIQGALEVPLCIDTPNPEAMERALLAHRVGRPILNSVTLEPGRYEAVLRLAKGFGAQVIALAMGERGVPRSKEERVEAAMELVGRLIRDGIRPEDIYVDPVVVPVGADPGAGLAVVEAAREIKARFPEVHIVAGVSNVSFGLPKRALLNEALTLLLMGAGMDAVVCDPLDRRLMALIWAAEAVLGRDEFCMRYIEAAREGRLEG